MPIIEKGKAQNQVQAPNTASYSTFDLSKHIYTTMRFGENQVAMVMNAIAGDKVKVRCAHELKTYTLKAPLMTPIHMEKDYFQVPRMAILPYNWDLIYKQPSMGDDIDASEVGTSIDSGVWSGFLAKINTELINANTAITNAQTTEETYIGATKMFKAAILAEYVYSYGSLLNNMGCKMAAFWARPSEIDHNLMHDTFDKQFELFTSKIYYGMQVYWDSDNGKVYTVSTALNTGVGNNVISMHEFLTRLRDQPEDFHISAIYKSATGTEITTAAEIGELRAAGVRLRNARTEYAHPVDLARLWAYQLINAEFFTNDKVDYIYNANLFRQYIGDLVDASGQGAASFEWNGIYMPYDYMSAYYFAPNMYTTINYSYAAALFSYRRSLKYLDYFTGSKTRPLAIGDVNVNVNNNKVSVIDITKNIQKQRFLNAVNRIRGNVEEYTEGLFGIKVDKDWHNPIWLGSTREAIRTSETENTAQAQWNDNSVTAHLEGYGGNYEFTFEIDRDSIIIGLCFFDIERNYARGTHRSFMHVNRYDMYNPYLQYTGDQEIWGAEYDTAYAASQDSYFGYVPAYEEFKQEINEAQGGFVTALPGYTFIDGMERDNGMFRPTPETIGPDFIRSKPVEMDRYYANLTGNSLANYFHFILDIYNEIEAKRPMAFNPQIL